VPEPSCSKNAVMRNFVSRKEMLSLKVLWESKEKHRWEQGSDTGCRERRRAFVIRRGIRLQGLLENESRWRLKGVVARIAGEKMRKVHSMAMTWRWCVSMAQRGLENVIPLLDEHRGEVVER